MLKHMLFGGGIGIKGDSWVATLDGSDYDIGYSVAAAPDGSVYVCGYTRSVDGGYDFYLAKFSSSGTVQWQKASYCDVYNLGYSVAVAPDGSVYVCGETNLPDDDGWSELYLAKFSSSGTVQWQKALGGSGGHAGRSVAVAPDGSVYVCGQTKNGAESYDLLLAKFSSSGTVQWQKTFGGSDSDFGRSVAVAPDGSVYVCGDTNSDVYLAKLSSSGTVQWQKTLGDKLQDWGCSVAVAPDGSVYVCGHNYTSTESYDLLLAKFSSSGTVQWQKTLSGSGNDYGYSVAVAPDGSVYVCGETLSTGTGNSDLLLAKITDSLIEQDTVTFGNLTFQDASLTLQNASLTITSSSLPVSNAGLTVETPSLTMGTPSFTTNLYTL